MIGHSFGGAAAVAAGAINSNYKVNLKSIIKKHIFLKATICLDGWFYPIDRDLYWKTYQPVLLLNASKWQWPKNVKRMKQMNSEVSEKIMFTIKYILFYKELDALIFELEIKLAKFGRVILIKKFFKTVYFFICIFLSF